MSDLINEYSPSMDKDVLHNWAQDAVKEMKQLQQRVVELEAQNNRLTKMFNDAPESDHAFTDAELAEHDAEVARKAFMAGNFYESVSIPDIERAALEYAEQVRRGEA